MRSTARIALTCGSVALPLLLAACVTETSGNVPGAKANLTEAARVNTELGADYARKGMYKVAEAKLKLAISERPDYAPAHSALAYVYSQRNQTDLAQAQYRRALSLAPDDPNIQNNYGVFLCAQGQVEQAQHYFRAAVANPNYDTPEAAWTNAGVCARSHGALDEAENDLRRALQINSTFPSALQQMALLSYQRKQYLRVRAFYQRYQQIAKPGPALLYAMARSERALGNADAARDYETQLVQQYPDSDETARLTRQNSP